LGASIGLFENVVANWRESRRMPRQRGAFLVAALCFVLAVGPALSSNVLSHVRVGDRGLLEFLDAALINWCLPIAALVICQVVCWMLKADLMKAEFVDADSPGSEKLFKHWIFVLRYVVTPVVLLALLMQLVSLF
jgi:SNF family Na+-dependent transporter